MGGCVVSMLDARASHKEVPNTFCTALASYGPQSLPVPNSETPTSTAIYLNGPRADPALQKSWATRFYDGPNQAQRFMQLCEDHLDDVAVSYRRIEKIAKEKVEGSARPLDVSYLSDVRAVTYREMHEAFMGFARGLAELGIPARSSISIYEETRWEWLASIYGIWMTDMVASTVYANLGEDALFYALKETECAAMVCNGKSVPMLLKGVADQKFPPCTIIYLDSMPTGADAELHGCRVVSWKSVVTLGSSEAGRKHTAAPPTNNDDLALIMYTSGTTGDPKGVMHSHGSLTAGILTMDDWLYSCVDPYPEEVYLSYLPLAHILEFGVVNILLARRAHVAFGNPRTLTDNMSKPHGDFTEFRPTLFIGVPRVFDTLKKAVEAKLPPPGTLKRKIFDQAYESRLAALQKGNDTPFWDAKVFKVARAALGGRIRSVLSGGGPISRSTQEFINVVFCLAVVGWGLTETICCGAIMRVGDMKTGVVGQVLASEELKLVDTEDYKHTDKPEPRGELCLRGPFLFKGYYKHAALTAEVMDDDGWFHTGDIGSIDAQGRVSLIGRIKALAKNCLGEYIALETLESIYGNHPLVLNNCLCVLVDPDRNYICALALTDEGKVRRFAAANKIEGKDYAALLTNKQLLQKAAESLTQMGKEASRRPFELIRHVCLVDDDWSPEGGQLTAALKLKRNVLAAQYEKEMAAMFAE